MQELEIALKKFVHVANNFDDDINVSQLQLRKELVAIMPPFPLGNVLSKYLSLLCIERRMIVGKAMYLTLLGLNDLVTAQNGWRWIVDRSSGQMIENPTWLESWIIIADKNGDVIFVDDCSEHGATYGSIQQRNFIISNDLASFFSTISECMEVERDKFNYDVMDDDFNVLQAFIDEVKLITEKKLGIEGSAGFIKFFFG